MTPDTPTAAPAPTQPARAHLAERVVTDPAALPAALDDETRIPASGRFAETIPAIPEPTNCDLELLQFLPATYHSWLEHGGVHIVPSLIRLLADARRDIERLRTVNEALTKAAGRLQPALRGQGVGFPVPDAQGLGALPGAAPRRLPGE